MKTKPLEKIEFKKEVVLKLNNVRSVATWDL